MKTQIVSITREKRFGPNRIAIAFFLCVAGCSTSAPTTTLTDVSTPALAEHPATELVEEAHYLDDRSLDARETINEYWLISAHYYMWELITEDTYYDFYYLELKKAEMELDILNHDLMFTYGGDYSRLEDAAEHLTNLEDILNTVRAELSDVEVNFLKPPPADRSGGNPGDKKG